MAFRIDRIELYVRETPPGRMAFALGKDGLSADAKRRLLNPLAHVRMIVRDGKGNEAFGCAGDRLSVRWLDKRPGRSHTRKRRELVSLIEQARDVWLAHPEFDSPFDQWRTCHQQIMKAGDAADQEGLTSSFASALFERGMVDAVCRLAGNPVFLMVKTGQLGFQPAAVHPELKGLPFEKLLPQIPATRFAIRHTVGLLDPLTTDDQPKDKRVNDGLPETLAEYVRTDGIRCFKVKVSGNPDFDVQRLSRVWDVVAQAGQPLITLDANEAYSDLTVFEQFVRRFERENLGAFQHIAYIEQPLPRRLTLDAKTEKAIRSISEIKPLIIDEADGRLDSWPRAKRIGYAGTSHKNCKGFFKSLMNHALAMHWSLEGDESFISAEDLQNLPVVPLQQDFATLGILGVEHCERNGHHYNYGLSLLSEADKSRAVRQHPDLYVQREDESFLRIEAGMVECSSIHLGPGFGVLDEPDWASMRPLREWCNERHPATSD